MRRRFDDLDKVLLFLTARVDREVAHRRSTERYVHRFLKHRLDGLEAAVGRRRRGGTQRFRSFSGRDAAGDGRRRVTCALRRRLLYQQGRQLSPPSAADAERSCRFAARKRAWIVRFSQLGALEKMSRGRRAHERGKHGHRPLSRNGGPPSHLSCSDIRLARSRCALRGGYRHHALRVVGESGSWRTDGHSPA